MKLLTMLTYANKINRIKYPDLEWKQYREINKQYGNTEISHVVTEDVVGDFRVEYSRYENDFFGCLGKFDDSSCNAKFWKGDKLLFQKEISGNTMVLYGDGKTLEGTYYTTIGSSGYNIDIYNLDNVSIRTTSIGYMIPKALKKINDKYMVCNTSEPCTHCELLGLIDMSLFFDPLYHSDYIRPYDNSRIGIDVEGDIIPVEATPAGFIIKNIQKPYLEYPILPYEDLENFDFYQDDNSAEVLNSCENNFEFTSDITCK
jgi:hypothetical protein